MDGWEDGGYMSDSSNDSATTTKRSAMWAGGIKVTIEITDFDSLALLVDFLSKNGFKVKSKDDQTLVKSVSK
jgi:hypothetical protein